MRACFHGVLLCALMLAMSNAAEAQEDDQAAEAAEAASSQVVSESEPPPDRTHSPESPGYAEFGCPPSAREYPNHYVLCVEAFDGRVLRWRWSPSIDGIVQPNHPFLVMVRHSARYKVKITPTGKVGTYVPGVEPLAPPQADGTEFGMAGGGVPQRVTTIQELPPQLPGPGGIRISMLDGVEGKWMEVDSVTVQFVIDRTYSGAIRLGVGATFLGAVDGQYAVRTVPGASQSEIVAEEPLPVNLELVLGYAAFLEPNGRSERGCASKPFCLAPYFGIGLLSQNVNDDSLAFLTSLYLGIEVEPVKNFSIAVAGVGRRVDRLATGLEVGSPVPSESNIITKEFAFGLGVVLNVSPSFFKIASGGAAAALQ